MSAVFCSCPPQPRVFCLIARRATLLTAVHTTEALTTPPPTCTTPPHAVDFPTAGGLYSTVRHRSPQQQTPTARAARARQPQSYLRRRLLCRRRVSGTSTVGLFRCVLVGCDGVLLYDLLPVLVTCFPLAVLFPCALRNVLIGERLGTTHQTCTRQKALHESYATVTGSTFCILKCSPMITFLSAHGASIAGGNQVTRTGAY